MPAALDIAFWNTRLAPCGDTKNMGHRIEAGAAMLSAILREPNVGFVGLCEVNEEAIESLRDRVRREGWTWQAIENSGGLGVCYDEGRVRPIGDPELLEVDMLGRTLRVCARVDVLLQPQALPLTITVSHWPSRVFGEPHDNDRLRCESGKILKDFATRGSTSSARAVVCGDFNDEPFSRAIDDWATRDPGMAIANNLIFNPSWAMLSGDPRRTEHPHGTATYKKGLTTRWRTFDQIMVSPALLRGELAVTAIRRWDDIFVTHQPSRKQHRFDHVPISLRLESRSES